MPVKINFVGDIGLFKKFEELQVDPFTEIKLPTSDLNIGNFEFMVPKEKNKFFYDVQEKYSCSYKYAKNLSLEKFACFGLANNHSLDYGIEGATDTIKLLNEKKIKTFGFTTGDGYTTANIESKGVKITLIGCVKKGRWTKENFGYGPDTYNIQEICNQIQALKDKTDHIIVFVHWGTELVEIPDSEDVINAQKFIDTGATAVIGHHPHVCQGAETYKNGLIAYSLGSFIYVHEDEVGFNKNDKRRQISICLNLELDKKGIVKYNQVFYQYNILKKIPETLNNDFSTKYAYYLNSIIHNNKLFRRQYRRVFLMRELKSFFERLREDPAKTISAYIRLINLTRLKKII